MAFEFGGSSQRGSSSQTTQQESDQATRSSQTGRSTQTQRIAGAGEQEQTTLAQLMEALYANLQGASGLVSGGMQDSINTGIAEYNRLIEEGSKTALGVMSKSGMNSSLVNNMMGSMQKGAAGNLASNIMNLQANMPFQALNAVNSAASPLMGMLQGYFLNERGMNVDSTGFSTQHGGSSTRTEGTSVSEGTSRSSGFNFGVSR